MNILSNNAFFSHLSQEKLSKSLNNGSSCFLSSLFTKFNILFLYLSYIFHHNAACVASSVKLEIIPIKESKTSDGKSNSQESIIS
jgi:hypothetical protein